MRALVTTLLTLALLSGFVCAEDVDDSPARWEKTIAGFEAKDRKDPVEPGGILFLGSSSIRMWELDKWFPGLPVLNRGFGGSEISDSLYYFDRIVLPYQPSTIVFYAGDNDIARNKSADTVASDFKNLAVKVWEHLPETRILFIGIKPSTARWTIYPEMKKVNEAVRQMAQSEPRLVLVDVERVMLGEDGLPRPEFLQKDGLHMTDAGYAAWTKLILPLLPAPPAA